MENAITSVVMFITNYVTKVTNLVTIHIKCVINKTSVTFGETGGVFKKKFKKSSKVQKKFKSSKRVQKFREWNLVVNSIHIFFDGGAASFAGHAIWESMKREFWGWHSGLPYL